MHARRYARCREVGAARRLRSVRSRQSSTPCQSGVGRRAIRAGAATRHREERPREEEHREDPEAEERDERAVVLSRSRRRRRPARRTPSRRGSRQPGSNAPRTASGSRRTRRSRRDTRSLRPSTTGDNPEHTWCPNRMSRSPSGVASGPGTCAIQRDRREHGHDDSLRCDLHRRRGEQPRRDEVEIRAASGQFDRAVDGRRRARRRARAR